jgi:hypothetical protein
MGSRQPAASSKSPSVPPKFQALKLNLLLGPNVPAPVGSREVLMKIWKDDQDVSLSACRPNALIGRVPVPVVDRLLPLLASAEGLPP